MHASTDHLRRALEPHGLKLHYCTCTREWRIATRDGPLLCRASTARDIRRLARDILERRTGCASASGAK